MENKTSEFGKGLTYCIGLFLAHAYMFEESISKGLVNIQHWFNVANDHLVELNTSAITDLTLKAEIENWQDKVIKWGHGFPRENVTKEDKEWAINEGFRLLRCIDEQLLNIHVIEGRYE